MMGINWECDSEYLMALSIDEQCKLLMEGRVTPNAIRRAHNLKSDRAKKSPAGARDIKRGYSIILIVFPNRA